VTESARIDVHTHFIPSFYAEWLSSKGRDSGGRSQPAWSPELALDLQESIGIARSILSISTPGVHLGDDGQARTMARRVNEFAGDLAREHPGRIGQFATALLPDVEGSLEEVTYALDELGAEGVVLPTSVGGAYPGDPLYEPLLSELDRRGAVVFLHPGPLHGAPLAAGVPPFAVDFLLDTARAALSLIFSGTLARLSSLRIVLSHGGGFLPYVAGRILGLGAIEEKGDTPDVDLSVEALREALRSFYYDTAVVGASALPSLTDFAAPDRIVFGSTRSHSRTASARPSNAATPSGSCRARPSSASDGRPARRRRHRRHVH
jgi:predicted TIM-barrel fold metal-dependent hydrolase